MIAWLEQLGGQGFASAVLWTGLALVLLIIVLIVIRLVRSLTFGTFVAGGRNRKTRLAVMDATAVDSHRRLVLVRRDDVEHLILIGGPTDVVVEQNIRAGMPQQRRPAPAETIAIAEPQIRRPAPPTAAPQQPAGAPQPRAPEARPAEPRMPEPRIPEPRAPEAARAPAPPVPQLRQPHAPQPPAAIPARPADPRSAPPRVPAAALATNSPPPAPAAVRQAPAPTPNPAPRAEISLEDEMNKLLGELTAPKR